MGGVQEWGGRLGDMKPGGRGWCLYPALTLEVAGGFGFLGSGERIERPQRQAREVERAEGGFLQEGRATHWLRTRGQP